MAAPLLSRRKLLTTGAIGAGAIAAGCGPDLYDGTQPNQVYAARVLRVPDEPGSESWVRTAEKAVALGPQDVTLPQRTTAVVPEIRVRALHDGATIAFRLEWDDSDTSDLTVRVEDFRDACAVLLAAGSGNATLRMMGSATNAATLLQWKADWQRDVDAGRQGIEAAYPNRCVDTYPPLTGTAPEDVNVAAYENAGATEWLPGLHVGNPLAQQRTATCVEKSLAYGFGTLTTCATQDARGRGVRTGTGWSVVLVKPLAATEPGEHPLAPGGSATCAFAIWSGSTGDGGSRKSPSATAYHLVLAA